jgi:hypothetical protein
LKIDPPEAELMSLRSVLFKSEDVLSQFFCIESKEITFKDLKPMNCAIAAPQGPLFPRLRSEEVTPAEQQWHSL